VIVRFKNPHPSVGGPVEILPEEISKVLRILDGMTKTTDFALGALAYSAPDEYWLSLDTTFNVIRLLHCDTDYPDEQISVWKLIEFEEVKE